MQGAGPQFWNLQADNLPFGLGVEIIGFTDAGILDMSLFSIGQPGCQLRATLDSLNAFVASGSHPWSFQIPGGAPSLSGIVLFTQVALIDITFDLSQTLTTNGIQGMIGNL